MKIKFNQLKVMTIFGTRPEIIRLSRIMAKLDECTHHITVYTGQSYDYEMSKIFFDDLEIRKPDYFLGVKANSLGEQLGNIISKSEKVLQKEIPDAVLILGDTNSALAAIVAKRMKIPIFHMEAGNRCFDENVPEEINRRIVDHISDINLPYSDNGRLYLIREGIHPATIFVTGSPLAEVLKYYQKNIEESKILQRLKLEKRRYFLASIHREENVDNKRILPKLLDDLEDIAENYGLPILVSLHPRTRKRLKEWNLKAGKLINFHKPFGYFDYVNLQKNAFCVISDSGTIPEEAAILGFPAIQLRNSSERPEAYDEGVLILSGLEKNIILQAVEMVIHYHKRGGKINIPRNYCDINVSEKVARLIIGFSRIIKKKYWF